MTPLPKQEAIAQVLRRDRDGMRVLRRRRLAYEQALAEDDRQLVSAMKMFSWEIGLPTRRPGERDIDLDLALAHRSFSIAFLGRRRGRPGLPPLDLWKSTWTPQVNPSE